MDEADLYADEIAIINGGRIVASGTSESLKHTLGGEIISLEVENSEYSLKALETLKMNNVISDVIVSESEVNILTQDAESSLPKIMEALRINKVLVKRVSINKPTLDDVFLKYAGTRIETAERISNVRQMRRMIRRG
jgi:ABC-2 type transport system ATP-binding protein